MSQRIAYAFAAAAGTSSLGLTGAYPGTTDLKGMGDYVRIDGPHVWIEFVCQGGDHYHTIWRDRTTDYGAEFAF